jgi:hypothetical protein
MNMGRTSPPVSTEKATLLEDLYKVLKPSPLEGDEELLVFYRNELNTIRGGDKVERLKLRLKRQTQGGLLFKACLMGHSGVGKSTELSRLAQQIKKDFEVVRFSATDVLDPASFQPLDIVIVMMSDLVEASKQLGFSPSEQRLNEILKWFEIEENITTEERNINASLSAGAGLDGVMALFAKLKGDIKYASARSKKVTDYRISHLRDLLDVCNRLLDDCEKSLNKKHNKSWLFIGEDFDKAGITNDRLHTLFVTYGSLFKDLRTNLIFNIPISLYYSASGHNLPFDQADCFVLPDTPVFNQDHSLNTKGINAVEQVLTARIDLALFETAAVLQRVIIASGGNLRDLFTLVNYAADTAILRKGKRINPQDADTAIVSLRTEYERRLGSNPYDPDKVDYTEKAKRLTLIYNGTREAQMTDEVIYSLLRAKAVQEFNGQRWFGVHPLVVDILIQQGHLATDAPGGTFLID